MLRHKGGSGGLHRFPQAPPSCNLATREATTAGEASFPQIHTGLILKEPQDPHPEAGRRQTDVGSETWSPACAAERAAALWRLLLATAAWGLSFPTAKAVMEAQARFLPGYPEWFHAALVLAHRMILAALLMGGCYATRLPYLQRTELWQGVQLGLWGAAGMLLQTDAQNRIPASTSAFFTQFTSVFIPAWVAFTSGRLPPLRVIVASCLVIFGCALLSGVDFSGMGFGMGEWETILAAVLFSGQILCLEQKKFHSNDMQRVAVVMFSVKAAVLLPVVLLVSPVSPAAAGAFQHAVSRAAGWTALYTSPSMWFMLGLLTLFSTVFSYSVMTHWQPRVSSVQAGLIYATEPVFATLWALFLPAWFSRLADISYANESLSLSFFGGAFAIILANALTAVQNTHPAKPAKHAS